MRWHFVVLTVAMLAIAGCSHDDHATPPAAPASAASIAEAEGPPKPVVATEDDAVKRVSAAIARDKLSTLAPECLSFIHYASDQQGYVVDVHELHDAHCGGDPNVAPRLFTVEVDRMSGRLETDAADPAAGLFHPIQ
ncbi:MAG TPA: hypothetical protein VGO76_01835 [Luteibacter sp.]|jgi:hypothetical protein|nr:hypothetical protein [Luteibacter sp.]